MGRILMWVIGLPIAAMAVAQTAQAQAATNDGPPLPAFPYGRIEAPAPPRDAARPVALVSVESSLLWLRASDLRGEIRKETGFEVLSPAENEVRRYGAAAQNVPVMVITISRRSEVTVVCREAPEGVRWVRVKVPIRSVLDSAATLAAAVLGAAFDYQARLAEMRFGAIKAGLPRPSRASPPDAALEMLENPYYRLIPGVPAHPYLAPYNPYYFPRQNALPSVPSI